MIRKLVSLFYVFLSIAAWGGPQNRVHIFVADQEGNPVPDVEVALFWHEPGNMNEVIRSDEDGRLSSRESMKNALCQIDHVRKEGYAFDHYLNQHDLSFFRPSQYGDKAPLQIILRKKLQDGIHLLNPVAWRSSDKCGWIGGESLQTGVQDGSVRFDVDLFRRRIENLPNVDSERLHYVDFSVVPHFDANVQRWKLNISTTNVACGLLATTNRIYQAPSTGYLQRLEIGPDIYLHRLFTLYFITRTPKLYGMIVFRSGDILCSNGPRASFHLNFNEVFVNPKGERLLEFDEKLDDYDVSDSLTRNAVEAILLNHRYPREPDIKARIANRRNVKSLYKEYFPLLDQRLNLEIKINEVKSKMKGQSEDVVMEAIRSLSDKRKCVSGRIANIKREIERLNVEVDRLFLPDSP